MLPPPSVVFPDNSVVTDENYVDVGIVTHGEPSSLRIADATMDPDVFGNMAWKYKLYSIEIILKDKLQTNKPSEADEALITIHENGATSNELFIYYITGNLYDNESNSIKPIKLIINVLSANSTTISFDNIDYCEVYDNENNKYYIDLNKHNIEIVFNHRIADKGWL